MLGTGSKTQTSWIQQMNWMKEKITPVYTWEVEEVKEHFPVLTGENFCVNVPAESRSHLTEISNCRETKKYTFCTLLMTRAWARDFK